MVLIVWLIFIRMEKGNEINIIQLMKSTKSSESIKIKKSQKIQQDKKQISPSFFI